MLQVQGPSFILPRWSFHLCSNQLTNNIPLFQTATPKRDVSGVLVVSSLRLHLSLGSLHLATYLFLQDLSKILYVGFRV